MTRLRLITLVLLAAAPATANPHLERANEALDNLEFDEARDALDAALRAGDNDPSELAEIHMLSGIVAASFGDSTAALDAFRRLLTIDPQAVLGDGHAPKIVTPFESARESIDEGLIARYEPYAYGDEELVIVVESDPARLVVGVRVLFRDDDGNPHKLRADGARRIAIDLPELPVGTVKIGLVDEHGNRLVVMRWEAPEDESEDEVESEDETETEGEDESEDEAVLVLPATTPKPLHKRWKVWAGATAGFVTVGVFYGLQTRSDQKQLSHILANSGDYRYEDAVEVLDRATGTPCSRTSHTAPRRRRPLSRRTST